MAQIPTTVQAAVNGADAVAMLNGMMFPAKLLRVVLNGPAGSRAEVFLGQQRIDQTARGQSNSNEFVHAPEIAPGMNVSVRWPGQAAKASQCNATFTVER